MARFVPRSYNEIQKENRLKEDENIKKRRSSQEVAIERSKKRQELLDWFCTKYKIDITGELCASIKKIFRNPPTKNIPLAEYRKELDLIGNSISTLGLDTLTMIITTNASRGYRYLIYENQLLNPFKKKKTAKDNIEDHKTSANVKTAKISDFEGYRSYLENENDDEELKKFIKKEFGIEVIE